MDELIDTIISYLISTCIVIGLLLFLILIVVRLYSGRCVRTWWANGYKVKGEFVDMTKSGTGFTVHIRKTDGKMVNVPYAYLDETNQAYISTLHNPFVDE